MASKRIEFDMTILRAILLTLFVLNVATAASAAPVVAEPAVDDMQLADPAARKGTRNYRDGEPATTTPPVTTTSKANAADDADKLTQCMETWDAGTHITKSKWREICHRQLNDR